MNSVSPLKENDALKNRKSQIYVINRFRQFNIDLRKGLKK